MRISGSIGRRFGTVSQETPTQSSVLHAVTPSRPRQARAAASPFTAKPVFAYGERAGPAQRSPLVTHLGRRQGGQRIRSRSGLLNAPSPALYRPSPTWYSVVCAPRGYPVTTASGAWGDDAGQELPGSVTPL